MVHHGCGEIATEKKPRFFPERNAFYPSANLPGDLTSVERRFLSLSLCLLKAIRKKTFSFAKAQ
jgi:hypothetical protein